jgi:SpoVK/Ycf46/Vps4 family AAA+-type ATPase
MNETLQLIETKHPDRKAEDVFENLIGIERQKEELISTISFLFNKDKITKWLKDHHRDGLSFVDRVISEMPLIILSGEVGCGKSALANSIGTPIAKQLGKRLTCFETPSDIRGSGRVGELSARVTSAFQQAKARVKGDELGLLIVDEADDLATSRSQNQAHHEDRAGLNVLVKQIDSINREKSNLAVILITNRAGVLDPAIMRRASLHLIFKRPNDEERRQVFKYLFQQIKINDKELDKLVETSRREKIPFSYSDLINRIAKQALFKVIQQNKPFNTGVYLDILKESDPSPLIM